MTLKSFKGKQVVLYFIPKTIPPAVPKRPAIFVIPWRPSKAGAVVVGVSKDGKAAHQKFIAKVWLPFALLSDEDAAICTAYGRL